MAEVRQAAAAGAVIVPVRLARSDEVEAPPEIERLKGFDISELTPDQAASKLAEFLAGILAQPAGCGRQDRGRPAVGAGDSVDRPGAGRRSCGARRKIRRDWVFVVHGHDDDFLAAVVRFVHDLGVRPIVMKEIGGASTSLIQKFFEMGGAARYAIVLLSGDDFGAARFQYEDRDVGDRALQIRARQNVVLELGFFYGLLGWENVFVLERTPPKVFPNFELAIGLEMVCCLIVLDASGKWRECELHSRVACEARLQGRRDSGADPRAASCPLRRIGIGSHEPEASGPQR